MAGRIRTIKPEILSDSKAARLSDRAWRLWVSMWTLADDCGLVPSDANYLGSQVFWGSADRSAKQPLGELVKAGFVSLYVAQGERFAKINGWGRHQKIDKPSGARFPLPPDDLAKPREASRTFDTDHDLDQDHEGTTSDLPDPSGQGDFDFDVVYALYPRKEGKKKGIARCRSSVKSRLKYDALLEAVKNYAATVTDVTYAKHFDTFMGCWEDYIDAGTLTPRTSRPSTAPLEPMEAPLVSSLETL